MRNRYGTEIHETLLLKEVDGYVLQEVTPEGEVSYEEHFKEEDYDAAIIELSIRTGHQVTKKQLKGTRENYDPERGKKKKKEDPNRRKYTWS